MINYSDIDTLSKLLGQALILQNPSSEFPFVRLSNDIGPISLGPRFSVLDCRKQESNRFQ